MEPRLSLPQKHSCENNMPVKFGMRGREELERMLSELPHGAKQIALPAFSEYLIGDDSHGLKHYPPVTTQKYVRTFTLKAGWTVSGGVYRQVISNSAEYAPYVPRWKRYGWREWADVIASNMAGALRHAQAAVNAWIRSRGGR